MIVKVCGLREAENIRAIEEAGADWFGFIFYSRSPRFVDEPPAYLPKRGKRVGVFVHAEADEIMRRVARFNLQAVQLHGAATTSICHELRKAGLTVVRALPVNDEFLSEAQKYADVANYLLFDTPTCHFGGSGRTYDWSQLDAYKGPLPFLLSGGLSLAALPALRTFHHPMLAGYDLNSGFEIAPGIKDARAVKKFIHEQSL